MRTKKLFDDMDKKLLIELLTNGRDSSRQIAKRLNISVGTIISRIKRLEKEKIIKGYMAVLDHEKLGYELTAIINLRVSQGKLLEVENEISKMSNICAVYDITGEFDALVIAKFKNRKELSDFVKKLLSMPYVERTNTQIVLNTIKEDFRLL